MWFISCVIVVHWIGWADCSEHLVITIYSIYLSIYLYLLSRSRSRSRSLSLRFTSNFSCLHSLDVPMNSRPPHGPIVCHLFFQTKLFHVIVHTFQPGLSTRPTPTSTTIHLKIHTFLYPLLVVFPYNMTKPPKPTTSHKVRYTVYLFTIEQYNDILYVTNNCDQQHWKEMLRWMWVSQK